jgi:hypothetical protein
VRKRSQARSLRVTLILPLILQLTFFDLKPNTRPRDLVQNVKKHMLKIFCPNLQKETFFPI